MRGYGMDLVAEGASTNCYFFRIDPRKHFRLVRFPETARAIAMAALAVFL